MKPITYKGNIFKERAAHKMIAMDAVKQFCKKEMINYKLLISRDCTSGAVNLRIRAAKYLWSIGLSDSLVAYALNRERSTINNYKGR